jgi:hypothetical protein
MIARKILAMSAMAVSLAGCYAYAGPPRHTPACNELHTNERASATVIAEAPPKPEGGTLLNGLYHLTKREDFVGPTGDTNRSLRSAQATLAISASTGVSADVRLYWFEPSGELPLPVEQNERGSTPSSASRPLLGP